MAEFTLETGRNRKITVGSDHVDASGVFLTTAVVSIYPDTLVQSRLTAEQARQLGQALLDTADKVEPPAITVKSELEWKVDFLACKVAVLEQQLAEKEKPEQKYYIKLLDSDSESYINRNEVSGGLIFSYNYPTTNYQTEFTQAEIDSDPVLKQFEQYKVPVNA